MSRAKEVLVLVEQGGMKALHKELTKTAISLYPKRVSTSKGGLQFTGFKDTIYHLVSGDFNDLGKVIAYFNKKLIPLVKKGEGHKEYNKGVEAAINLIKKHYDNT